MKQKLKQKTNVFNDQMPEEKIDAQLEHSNFDHLISATSSSGKSVFLFDLFKSIKKDHGLSFPTQTNQSLKG